MKIKAISDFHGDLPDKGWIGECDVLCIAGDIVPLKMQRNIPQSASWIRKKFIPWVEELDCEHVVLVAGNHDFYFDKFFWTRDMDPKVPRPEQIFTNCPKIKYLQDSGCIIENKSFFGTPWITGLPGWAFYTKDDSEVMDDIPNVDVLITHAPPYGDVGTVLQTCWNYGNNFGSEELKARLERGGIKTVLSGHIHSGLHAGEQIGEAKCYNVSLKDEQYNFAFQPLALTI